MDKVLEDICSQLLDAVLFDSEGVRLECTLTDTGDCVKMWRLIDTNTNEPLENEDGKFQWDNILDFLNEYGIKQSHIVHRITDDGKKVRII